MSGNKEKGKGEERGNMKGKKKERRKERRRKGEGERVKCLKGVTGALCVQLENQPNQVLSMFHLLKLMF